ncbi:hypothetical protein EON80_25285, partial [bacterium]
MTLPALFLACVGIWNLIQLRFDSRSKSAKEVTDKWEGGLLLLFVAACLWGLEFPPVDHERTPVIGFPVAVVVLACFLAVPQCVLLARRSKWHEHLGAKIVVILGFVVFAFVNCGFVSLVNGLPDFGPSMRHATVVLAKDHWKSAKSGPT